MQIYFLETRKVTYIAVYFTPRRICNSENKFIRAALNRPYFSLAQSTKEKEDRSAEGYAFRFSP